MTITTSISGTAGGATRSHQRGELCLRLERRGEKTALTRRYFTEPFGPSWAIHPPNGSPGGIGAPEVQVSTPGAGVLGGDSYKIDVFVGPKASAAILTTGATKAYRGPASLQRARFRVEDGALLEYLPHHVIPYAGSSYRQENAFDLAPGASLLAWEAYSAGRVGRGERFGFDRLSGRTRILRGGEAEVAEGFELSGGGEPFGGYSYLGTVYASAPRGLEELAEKLHAALAGTPGALASASAPAPNLCVARVLARRAPALYRALNGAREAVRDFLGLPPPPREIR